MDEPRAEAVLPRLRGRFGRVLRYEPECASTQRLLDGRGEGAVAVTDFQSAGRGRLGRSWESPPGTAQMLSLVLEPRVRPERLPELTPLAGEAVAAAIGSLTGLRPTVKSPNDVLVDGRKVAGILGEAAAGRVLLGIGINVRQGADELPPRPQYPATSLALEGATVDRVDLLVEVLAELEARYDAWIASIA